MKTMSGKIAFIAGVADENGFGWAIAKALAEEGATIILGTWPPAMGIFKLALSQGRLDNARKLSDGSLMEFAAIYPLDAMFDTMEDVPEEIRTNKRYAAVEGYTISEVCQKIGHDFGKIDYFVHSLANGPEVKKPLLDTSRKGYLSAISASAYSFLSLVQHLGPIINSNGSCLNLTYIASEQVIPGYGGGMSSAKAALESDTRVLAWEAGRKWGIRINAISAGPLGSRAAQAIGFIEKMIAYNETNSPLNRTLQSSQVGQTAAFLLSEKASAITGTIIYVDNGMHAMGMAVDSASLKID